MITLTEENYIKAIYHISKQGRENVNTNALAEAMNTKASSATASSRCSRDRLAKRLRAMYETRGITARND